MRAGIQGLTSERYDLLIVGGGIHGAWAAWDASLRGLSVAVVDQGDFGAATSANSLRIVHGGLRYLARGELTRMRESVRERTALLRVAPHLVRPLPVLVPTYGSTPARLFLGAGLALNDVLTPRRNRGLPREQWIGPGRLVSQPECRRLFPAAGGGLSGGALWHDARLVHPERLALELILAAVTRGAAAANYLRAERIVSRPDGTRIVHATDLLAGEALEIRSRAVLLAAGPWTRAVESGTAAPTEEPRGYAFALNLVLRRRPADVAVGIRARSGADADPVCGGGRYLFMVPLEAGMLAGTWYGLSANESPAALEERGASALLAELSEACPELAVSADDLIRIQSGWLPLKRGIESGRADALAERPRISARPGSGGRVLAVEGVKYTTARLVAERAVTMLCHALDVPGTRCRTAEVVLPAPAPVSLEETVSRSVRVELAARLTDIVFRRTGLGEPPGPTREQVERVATIASRELGWDPVHQAAEVDAVLREAGSREVSTGAAR